MTYLSEDLLRPGGINQSVLSLITLCLGAGTLSIPYIFYKNGVVLGTLLLAFGASFSLYTGWLMAVSCHKFKA